MNADIEYEILLCRLLCLMSRVFGIRGYLRFKNRRYSPAMMIPIGIYVIYESQWWCDGIIHVCCPQDVGVLEVTGALEEDEITLHTIFQT